MWKDNVQPGRPQMKIWRMHTARCITEAINTHSGYVRLIVFPLQQRFHARVIITLPVLSLGNIKELQFSAIVD